jgi:hypothetical protein
MDMAMTHDLLIRRLGRAVLALGLGLAAAAASAQDMPVGPAPSGGIEPASTAVTAVDAGAAAGRTRLAADAQRDPSLSRDRPGGERRAR